MLHIIIQCAAYSSLFLANGYLYYFVLNYVGTIGEGAFKTTGIYLL